MKKILSLVISSMLLVSTAGTSLISVNATESACPHPSIVETIENATCTKNGKVLKRCSECDNVEKMILKATGHNIKIKNKKSATYVKKGYSGDEYCKTCKKVIKKGKNIKKLSLSTPSVTIKKNSKSISVTYNRVKNATGFQIRYFIKGNSITKTYNTNKTTTKTFKNLSYGTYTIYVRSYVSQNGKTAYSKWTTKKTITLKKPVSNNTSGNTTTNSSTSITGYWTASGTVYHCTKSCPSLSRSTNILSGYVPADRRACKRCH